MIKKTIKKVLAVTLVLSILSGCGSTKESVNNIQQVKLSLDNPVSLTVWHYYNGTQQATFDMLVDDFNATVGREQGIYVEGYSQGSVSDLEKAVRGALNGDVGAGALPDIFSSYADTAYSVQQSDKLVDLSQYFSEEELSAYVEPYVQEGYFNNDGALYLMPVAKSTEVMMINETDWQPFAAATGTTLQELSTLEGVIKVAERYYNWTDSLTPDIEDDGKSFYGRDSMSNYFIIGMKQMGKEIFEAKDGQVKFNLDKDLIRRLWDNYYVPYMKGYIGAYGRFRSDDVKTGDIIAYTGSTASALYFPDNIETEDASYPIDCIVLNPPIMEGGENCRVQQGAGMAVTKSDKEHEYAASVFLKWFTQKEENIRFVCDSAYIPVLKEANTMDAIDEVIKDNNISINEKAYKCLESILTDFDNTSFYTPSNFNNGYSVRKILDYYLSDKAVQDKKNMDEAIAMGASRQEELEKYLTDEQFDNWYEGFCNALIKAAEK